MCVRDVGVRYLSACWSTLGGAHSALGDCSQAHVSTHTHTPVSRLIMYGLSFRGSCLHC